MIPTQTLFADTDLIGAAADAAKFAMACGTMLTLAFLVLLALPKSQLRSLCLEVVSWASLAASGLYIVSPLDIIPDVIPVVGWIDDLGAAGCGVFSLVTAVRQRGERRRLAQDAETFRIEDHS